MRILLTADPDLPVPPPGYGGIERIVDALVRRFQSTGHTVALLAHPASTSPASARFPWAGAHAASRLDTVRNTLRLRAIVQAFRPDIVHSFSRLAYLLPILRGPLPKLMSYQRHTGGRQIAWATRLAGDSLAFTGCSEFIAAMGRRAGGTWHAIPNFVECDRIAFAPHVPADAPLLFLSRVEEIKGAHLAIAIARAAGRRLVIAGNRASDGAGAAYWTREIAPRLGRDGIEYVGEVGDAEKSRLLGNAAALLVPIQWDEPFGIVFAEALAAGTPVISCARGALPEIVEAGRTGWFVNTIEDGVAAIRRLPEIDRAACRRSAQERFDVSVCAAGYAKLYHAMIAARALPPAAR